MTAAARMPAPKPASSGRRRAHDGTIRDKRPAGRDSGAGVSGAAASSAGASGVVASGVVASGVGAFAAGDSASGDRDAGDSTASASGDDGSWPADAPGSGAATFESSDIAQAPLRRATTARRRDPRFRCGNYPPLISAESQTRVVWASAPGKIMTMTSPGGGRAPRRGAGRVGPAGRRPAARSRPGPAG